MAQFIYEKMVLRLAVVGTFTAVLFLFFFAFFIDGGIWAPRLEHAPFVERDENGNFYEAKFIEYPLKDPHLTENEISSWASITVSEAMSFQLDGYRELYEKMQKNFTDTGFLQYEGFLKQSGVFDNLKSGFRISSFIDQQPLLLNNASVDNVYRWLYQLPVTITFLPLGQDYQGENEALTQKMTLRVQIRRVKLPDDPRAIQIESWDMTRRVE